MIGQYTAPSQKRTCVKLDIHGFSWIKRLRWQDGFQKFDRIVFNYQPFSVGSLRFPHPQRYVFKLSHSGDRFQKIAFSPRIRVDGT